MVDKTTIQEASGVPRQIFDTYLAKLANKGIPAEVIERLRITIIERRYLTENAVQKALFTDDPTQ